MNLDLFETNMNRREFIANSLFAGSFLLVSSELRAFQALAAEPSSYRPFFTESERVILGDACNRSFHGAAELGAVNFIEQLLTAFDSDPPRIYAAGPFSSRGIGAEPSTPNPTNGFAEFLPLTRLQNLSWRAKLFGPNAALGWSNNPYVQEEFRLYSLRDLIRFGVHCLSDFDNPAESLESVRALPQFESVEFRNTRFLQQNFFALQRRYQKELRNLTLQGCFSAPEYGGNKNLAGWRLIQFPGDNCPEGNTKFDPSIGDYTATSLANLGQPDRATDPAPLGGWVDAYLELINLALKTGLM